MNRCIWISLAFLGLTGCMSPYVIRMPAVEGVAEDNAVSNRVEDRRYERLIVIPPSGTARGQFDSVIALFEKEFLKSDLTVVSSSITGRVVYEQTQDEDNRRVEGAQGLSDTERALVMAKETGADAIIQIGRWEWREEGHARFFVLSPETHTFSETDQNEYWNRPPEQRYSFASPSLHFVGRLLDIEDGQVVASFEMECPANWCLPGDYRTELARSEVGWMHQSESFPYSGPWIANARAESERRVIRRVAELISPARSAGLMSGMDPAR